MSDSSEKVGIITQGRNYFSESVAELKKVAKPTRQEAMQATLVTVALVVFVAIVVALFDALFGQVMKMVIS